MLTLQRSAPIMPCTPPPRVNRATLPYDPASGLPLTPDDPNEHEYAQQSIAGLHSTPISTLLPAPPILSPVLRSAARQRKKTGGNGRGEPLPPTSPLLKSPAIMNLGIFTAIAQAEEEQQQSQQASPFSQCDSLPTPELGFFSPASTYATSCTSFASPFSDGCFTSPPTSYEAPSPFLESSFEELYLANRFAHAEIKSPKNVISPLLEAHQIHSALGLFGSPLSHVEEVAASDYASSLDSPTLTHTSSNNAPVGLKLSLYLATDNSKAPLTTSTSILPAMLSNDQVETVEDLKKSLITRLGLDHMHLSDQDLGLYYASPPSSSGSSVLAFNLAGGDEGMGKMMALEENLKEDYGLDGDCEGANIVAVINRKMLEA